VTDTSHRDACSSHLLLPCSHALNRSATDRQFSLSEISSIRLLDPLDKEADGQLFSFAVTQAPISVVLRCKHATQPS
jgi:hypothetical protein